MNIIDRLLLREVLKTLLVILLVLLLVLLASHMVKLLGKAAAGSLSSDVLLLMVGLQSIKVLGVLLPPAFFFSLLWVLGGMYRDGEMFALQASGFSLSRLYRSVMLIAVPLALLSALLVFFISPWANAYTEQVKFLQSDKTDISGLRLGRFNQFSDGNLVIYTQMQADTNDRLQQVFIQDRQQDQLAVVLASEVFQSVDPNTGERFIVLRNGTRYQGTPGQVGYAIAHFDEYALRIPKLDLGSLSLRIGAQPTALLWLNDTLSARAELQYRLSVPLGVLVFALLAVPLARAKPRQDIYARMTLAVFIYFLFMNLQRVSESWMERAITPAWLGMWWVPLLMLGLAGLLILFDSQRFKSALRRRRRGMLQP